MAAISRPGMNEIWLAGVSGIVLVTLLALQVALNIHLAFESRKYQSGGPLAAAWAVCFFIYMAYALLPIRLRHACIAGIIFSLVHLIGAFVLYPSQYPAMMEHVSDILYPLKHRTVAILYAPDQCFHRKKNRFDLGNFFLNKI